MSGTALPEPGAGPPAAGGAGARAAAWDCGRVRSRLAPGSEAGTRRCVPGGAGVWRVPSQGASCVERPASSVSAGSGCSVWTVYDQVQSRACLTVISGAAPLSSGLRGGCCQLCFQSARLHAVRLAVTAAGSSTRRPRAWHRSCQHLCQAGWHCQPADASKEAFAVATITQSLCFDLPQSLPNPPHNMNYMKSLTRSFSQATAVCVCFPRTARWPVSAALPSIYPCCAVLWVPVRQAVVVSGLLQEPAKINNCSVQGASQPLFACMQLAGYPRRCRSGPQSQWWRTAGPARACKLAGYPRRCRSGPQSPCCRTAGPARACELAGYPQPLPERPAVTVVAHSRACACMRARRVPAPLPEQPAVTVVQHSEVCACMRARRVPRPLPGRLVATVALHSKV